MINTIHHRVMTKINSRLCYMLESHNKVLVVRFDIRFPQGYTPTGVELSNFIKLFKEYHQRHGLNIHYIWVREQANGAVHHYHLMIMVNGSIMQNPYCLLQKADEIWARVVGYDGPGLVHFCNTEWMGERASSSTMIRRPSSVATGMERVQQEQQFQSSIARVHAQADYLAKEETKGEAPYRMREFGCSRLKKN